MSSFTEDLLVSVMSRKRRGRTLFTIRGEFEYRVGDFENPTETISVPEGFVTDFQSFPRLLRVLFDNAHRAKAAVVHDYLLFSGRKPKEADRIFREAMGVLGAHVLERNLFYIGVRINSIVKQLLGIPVHR